MILVRVTTEVIFKDEKDLYKFIEGEAKQVTSFPDEIRKAYRLKQPERYTGTGPKSAKISNSLVECYNIGE